VNDPLGLLPLAIAGGGGRLDAFEAQQLVAAGLTLLSRSAPLVRALARRRAAILLPSAPAFVTALAASEGRGAVLVNPLAAPLEIAHQLDDADVGAVFTIASLAVALPSGTTHVLLDDAPRSARVIAGDRVVDVDLGTHHGLAIEGATDAPGSSDEATIVYTSAMHGTPLGAIGTHRNLLSNARAMIVASGLDADDHALAVLPFSHLFGLVVSGVAPLLTGGRVTTMPRFNPVRAVEILEGDGVTLLVGVPAVFAALAATIVRRGTAFGAERLRLCICGGAPLSTELQDRWLELTGLELRQGYGLTEAGPVCLFNRVDLPNRRGTLGEPFPGVDVQVADVETGVSLPAGVDGEICVSGENVSPGYVRDGAHGLVRRGRWLRTGDLGALTNDGAIAFRGVIKPMFTRNGFNIYPREIERALLELAGVREAAVEALPEPARENDIAVDVVGAVTEEDVRRWCRTRLSAYKQPSRVTVRS
jgi:long-chain acyl-CoA synthetase